MARYLVIYNVDGTRHSEQLKLPSAENAEYKLRGRYPNSLKFEIVSIQPKQQSKHAHGTTHRVPTFKQFACSFSVMNNGTYEAHQIALYALDEASAKETLHRDYPNIIMRTIRVVEAS